VYSPVCLPVPWWDMYNPVYASPTLPGYTDQPHRSQHRCTARLVGDG